MSPSPMKLTPWFNAKLHSPARDGWYDCKECNARHYFKNGLWYRDKKSLKVGPMVIDKMHWRGLRRPALKSLLAQFDPHVPRSAEEQAWENITPVGREFGSKDFELLNILDSYSLGSSSALVAMNKLLKQVKQMVSESGSPEGFDAQTRLITWMKTSLPSLGGKCPFEMIKTKDDQELVASLLAKMQSGSYA